MEGNFSMLIKGKIYKIKRNAQVLSEMLKDMKDIPEDLPIPLETDSNTFEKILEYLNHFNGKKPQEIQKPLLSSDMKKATDEWSANFIDKLTVEELVNLTTTSYLMKINSLLNLCCAKMVALCKGKTQEEIFNLFGVSSDFFTPEKIEQIKESNKWVDDIFQ
jgi:hypothetical protein